MKNTHPIELVLVAGLVLLEALAVLVVAGAVLVVTVAAGCRRSKPMAPPAMAAPLAGIADELRRLPAARLREIHGTHRRVAKDRLIADLLALPV